MEIIVWDAVDCVGGNKVQISADGTTFLLDFGLNYNRYNLYFREFLTPRVRRGIYDHIMLNLLPPLRNLYREDLFPADLQEGEFLANPSPSALLLSHPHLDHCAQVFALREDIPIYTSLQTAITLKAMQDCGSASEVTYISKRLFAKDDSRVLEADRGAPYKGRQYFLVDSSPNEEVQNFWAMPPSPPVANSRRRPLEALPLGISEGKIGNLPLLSYPIDHSVFGATAYAVQTSQGWIVYTGDIRLHGAQGPLSQRFVESASRLKPFLLIIEGTRVGQRGQEESKEEAVYQRCLEASKRAENLIIADFAPRNVERLITFLDIARELNRELVILPRDAYLLHALWLSTPERIPFLKEEPLRILNLLRLEIKKWESDFLYPLYREKYVSIEEISLKQGEFILCLSLPDMTNLLDIKPEAKSLYIYSLSEAYNEEYVYDVKRLLEWLKLWEIQPIGISVDGQGNPIFTSGFHSSGHASEEEIFQMIREISPKYLLPLHTEHPERFAEEFRGTSLRVLLPKRGEVMNI